MKNSCWLLILSCLLAAMPCLAGASAVGVERLNLGRLSSGRPGSVDLWFPQGNCARPSRDFCLADFAITDKVVVFSHGAMGSAKDYDWLAERLAEAGFVVAGVDHYGESRTHGAQTQDVRSSALIWQRPQDISAVLDRLAADQPFQRPVAWNRVIAIGHSAGGQTASMLAGATFDLNSLREYCRSRASDGDRSCRYGSHHTQAPGQFVEQFNGTYQDARIQKIIMLDPALGAAARPASLREILVPSLVVGATHNDFMPWEQHGQRYASAIPKAKTILLNGQEGHFVFLSPCEHSIRVMEVPLCFDRPGVDRKAVQADLARQIVDFARGDNEVANLVQQQRTRSSATLTLVSQVLLYTPRWVYGLLAGLCVFGVMQARTRLVRTSVALLLPIAMVVLSFSGVLRYVGWQATALGCWAVGLAIIAILCLSVIDKGVARLDPVTGKLRIQGSWIPLLVILGIFVTRYALGVASAMQFPLAQTWYFPLAISLALGAWSGYFLARGIIFWRAAGAVTPAR